MKKLKFYKSRICIVSLLFCLIIYYISTSYFYKHKNDINVYRKKEIFLANIEADFKLNNVKIKIISNDPAKIERQNQGLSNEGACHIPKLQQNNPEIMKFYSKKPSLDCSKNNTISPKWVFIDEEGRLQLTNYAKEKYQAKVNCNLTYFTRKTDTTLNWKTVENFKIGEKIDESDFFEANCTAGDEKWKNPFMTIVPQKETIDKLKNKEKPKDWSGLNVYILGFDSLSQMAFRRNLPKTTQFLEETMGSVLLNGYNIVGDGTPQAYIPMLTGKTETELPNTRRRYRNANYVDVYPFIWNNFSDAGYVTLYGEDVASIDTFAYRLKGFKNQPTNHYTRPFFVKLEKIEKEAKCIGPDPQIEIWLNYAKEFYRKYPKEISKFLLMHHTVFSHNDDVTFPQLLDEPLSNHLKEMFESGMFDDALVIVMADHGHRFAKLRGTHQGQLEERLPFYSIYLPSKFRETEKGKTAYKNLKINADRLSSPFDIYSTLMDIIYFPSIDMLETLQNESSSRSLSLFREIPKERSCHQAGIEPHWCTCLNWESALKSNETKQISNMLAEALVQAINVHTEKERKFCSPLKLHSLEDSQRLVPHEKLLKYNGAKDKDGFVPQLKGNVTANFATYKVTFVTTPGDGKYEATLFYDKHIDEITIDFASISRVNKYGDLPHCIVEKDYFLAPYCVCYDKL